MPKLLNEEELDKVTGGAFSVSNSEMASWVGKPMWFETRPKFYYNYRRCGLVRILAFEDPYVYVKPFDLCYYEQMMLAYEEGCALEPCTLNGDDKCFKIDNGPMHMTFLYNEDPAGS